MLSKASVSEGVTLILIGALNLLGDTWQSPLWCLVRIQINVVTSYGSQNVKHDPLKIKVIQGNKKMSNMNNCSKVVFP